MYVLKNKHGMRREAPRGFSWTMLFFGVFVPLFRGDWKWFFISLLLSMITFGVSWLIMPFLYNNLYLNDLLKDGYEIV